MNIRLPASAALLLATALPAFAQLPARSPFLPAAGTATEAGAPATTVEFLGYVSLPEGALYRVSDPSRKAAAWLRLGERDADFGGTARSYDAARELLTLDYQGRTLELSPRKAKVKPSAAAGSTIAPLPALSAQLEALAHDLAQRRADRGQLTQPSTARPAPPPSAPPATR